MSRAALTLARAALVQIIPTTPDYREQHAAAMAAIDAALAEPDAARVPLTDEHIHEIYWPIRFGSEQGFARAIERAHGITPAIQEGGAA